MGFLQRLGHMRRSVHSAIGGNALIVSKIYREPKGASPAVLLGIIPISFGAKSQRIQLGESKYLRFAIQLIGGALQSKINEGQYDRDTEWRELHVQEGANGREETVLVSVTSVAKRLGISKQEVLISSDQGHLERLIAGQSFVSH